MSDWRSLLHDADRGLPAQLPAADVQRVRESVMAAARTARGGASPALSRPFALVMATLVIVCSAMLAGLQYSTRPGAGLSTTERPFEAAATSDAEAGERQQLQFATPGGTRIIWVFDSRFDVEGTVP